MLWRKLPFLLLLWEIIIYVADIDLVLMSLDCNLELTLITIKMSVITLDN
jgi:hypothetical protein